MERRVLPSYRQSWTFGKHRTDAHARAQMACAGSQSAEKYIPLTALDVLHASVCVCMDMTAFIVRGKDGQHGEAGAASLATASQRPWRVVLGVQHPVCFVMRYLHNYYELLNDHYLGPLAPGCAGQPSCCLRSGVRTGHRSMELNGVPCPACGRAQQYVGLLPARVWLHNLQAASLFAAQSNDNSAVPRPH